MWTATKGVYGFGAIITFGVMAMISCQGSIDTQAAVSRIFSRQDSLLKVEKDTSDREDFVKVVEDRDGHLTRRWREPVHIAVDSLHPIRKDSLAKLVKLERRRIRDSVRIALDQLPKHIYLTFDDGPLLGSQAIDSLVQVKNVKANVFLVGKHRDMSKRLNSYFERYQANPLIACFNHSYTHAENRFTSFYSNPISAFEDFEKNEQRLGLQHKIVRLPGRNIWIYDDVRRIDLQSGASTADMLADNGYKAFGWDIEWKINGATGKPVESLQQLYHKIQHFMDNKTSMEPNNVVLLMHDEMFRTTKGQELLSRLIDTIQTSTDYRPEFMTDYPFRY